MSKISNTEKNQLKEMLSGYRSIQKYCSGRKKRPNTSRLPVDIESTSKVDYKKTSASHKEEASYSCSKALGGKNVNSARTTKAFNLFNNSQDSISEEENVNEWNLLKVSQLHAQRHIKINKRISSPSNYKTAFSDGDESDQDNSLEETKPGNRRRKIRCFGKINTMKSLNSKMRRTV